MVSAKSSRFNTGGKGSSARAPCSRMMAASVYSRGRNPGWIRGGSSRNVRIRQTMLTTKAMLFGTDAIWPIIPSTATNSATEKGRAKISGASSGIPGRVPLRT